MTKKNQIEEQEFQKNGNKKQVYKKREDGKNSTGRPGFYKDPQVLQKKVDEYFSGGHRRKVTGKDEKGNEIKVPMITMTDLAIFLGFDSRQSIYDYEKEMGGDFPYIIKRARLFIEREYEERLGGNAPTGAIFALKNMGWRDKSEQEITGAEGGPVEVKILKIGKKE